MRFFTPLLCLLLLVTACDDAAQAGGPLVSDAAGGADDAVVADAAADRYAFDRQFGGRDHPDRLRNRIRRRRDQLLRSPRWLAKKVARALGRHG